ncbi:MAG: Holliday junction resolvase RuvX [Muribaculaceae bacterium]|nr:Holliday junction resolvase RuvX [Muribaculaceae bacterium]
MGRILAIDYGKKRCGVAATDILRISANGLPTVDTPLLMDWLKEYCSREDVERILLGEPKQPNGAPSENLPRVRSFAGRIRKEFPDIPLEMVDERFTSVIAHREMIAGGFKKSDRQQKGRADEMSAVLILTDWLQSKSNFSI